MVTIRELTMDELFNHPDFEEVVEQYTQDGGRAPLYGPVNKEAYRHLEKSGLTRVLGAFGDNRLVGGLILVFSKTLHHSQLIVATDAFFVSPSARKGGVGLRLLKQAQELAKACGAVGVFASAPIGGALEKVLPRHGFKATNTFYFKEL
ncbi:GNAT family N-acetyltransferase [Basilea psittacipulmonis]|uniref:N-acetyltransferase domain-containing protein n=1 Tax=Basilea psittacipulmonis DSM 24701 TaxID=1072685 RepID=A0A077DEF3_9BURK|nr:GNAT family N-acetyltransferase [Basilea psittacipulmonis]AIL33104.1 hypothetical protein IX83_07115 [Basilea psittacipulmonis DSM 24701]